MSELKETFEQKLQKLIGNNKPEDIEELILDEFSKDIKSLSLEQKEGLELYTNLIHLSLNNIGLENLTNFPSIKSLMYLSLNDNKLNGEDFSIISKTYPNLYKLKISGNNIESIDNLSCLSQLQLKKIEVANNPFTKNNNEYREKIYKLIPTLEIVDQKLKNGQEIDTTDYGNMSSSSMEDEEYEDLDDNDDEDSDESDGNDDDSNDSEEEYNEDNEEDEGQKKKKKK
jgi:acidic leucine-rich nuclear phosphoprotein 32 family protein A/C/D